MKKMHIAVITGSRAEYGLLYWLMREIQQDPDLTLCTIVTGMHLSPEFGLTYQHIEADGFTIDAKVESQLSSDSATGISKSVGLGIIGFADVFAHKKIDVVVLLGDRFEILAAAQAALFAKIPIVHIHGGETTEGAFDESIRHAITKMSHLHFVAAEPYRQRVIQLGEDPSRVFNLGTIGLDHINKTIFLTRDELQKKLNFSFGKLNFLITYHPTTLDNRSPEENILQLFSALEAFPDAHYLFTGTNADTKGRSLNQFIQHFVEKRGKKASFFMSLGSTTYLSLMNQVDMIIGNSSSGIIEAPHFKKPTVNIGDRQKGRLRASSIIDCDESTDTIVNSIKKALKLAPQLKTSPIDSPYKNNDASLKIKEHIKLSCRDIKIAKTFYDL